MSLVESFTKVFDEIEERMILNFAEEEKIKLKEYLEQMMKNLE